MEFAPLDELYFQWLYAQVANTRLKNPARTYWCVTRQLYTTEFRWFVPNDDNRIGDAQELRYEFLERHEELEPDRNWMEEGASFLEMLIALSRRLAFADERGTSVTWFWTLLSNVQIDLTDSEYVGSAGDRVSEALDMLNNRTYAYDGKGGLFPLERADVDQRNVEIWYQMQYYLIERS